MDINRIAIKLDTSVRRSWIPLYILFVIGWVFRTGIVGDWAYAFGNILFPTLIGAWLIYRAKTLKGVILGYSVLAVLIGLLTFGDLFRTVITTERKITATCMLSSSIAHLSKGEKQRFCSCMGRELKWTIVSESAWATYTWQSTRLSAQNPKIRAKTQAARLQCAASI